MLILVNFNLDFKIMNMIQIENGHYILIDCEVQGYRMVLCNVFFPTSSREKNKIEILKKELQRKINNLNKCNNPVILGGDFNMIMNAELDYNGNAFKGHQHRFSKEVENIVRLKPD